MPKINNESHEIPGTVTSKGFHFYGCCGAFSIYLGQFSAVGMETELKAQIEYWNKQPYPGWKTPRSLGVLILSDSQKPLFDQIAAKFPYVKLVFGPVVNSVHPTTSMFLYAIDLNEYRGKKPVITSPKIF